MVVCGGVAVVPVFTSRAALKTAVSACIKKYPVGCCLQQQRVPIGQWDVSAVTDMSRMFYGAASFNQDLSAWNVAAVTNMSYMLYGAAAFNQSLSVWDVAAVINMKKKSLRPTPSTRTSRRITVESETYTFCINAHSFRGDRISSRFTGNRFN